MLEATPATDRSHRNNLILIVMTLCFAVAMCFGFAHVLHRASENPLPEHASQPVKRSLSYVPRNFQKRVLDISPVSKQLLVSTGGSVVLVDGVSGRTIHEYSQESMPDLLTDQAIFGEDGTYLVTRTGLVVVPGTGTLRHIPIRGVSDGSYSQGKLIRNLQNPKALWYTAENSLLFFDLEKDEQRDITTDIVAKTDGMRIKQSCSTNHGFWVAVQTSEGNILARLQMKNRKTLNVNVYTASLFHSPSEFSIEDLVCSGEVVALRTSYNQFYVLNDSSVADNIQPELLTIRNQTESFIGLVGVQEGSLLGYNAQSQSVYRLDEVSKKNFNWIDSGKTSDESLMTDNQGGYWTSRSSEGKLSKLTFKGSSSTLQLPSYPVVSDYLGSSREKTFYLGENHQSVVIKNNVVSEDVVLPLNLPQRVQIRAIDFVLRAESEYFWYFYVGDAPRDTGELSSDLDLSKRQYLLRVQKDLRSVVALNATGKMDPWSVLNLTVYEDKVYFYCQNQNQDSYYGLDFTSGAVYELPDMSQSGRTREILQRLVPQEDNKFQIKDNANAIEISTSDDNKQIAVFQQQVPYTAGSRTKIIVPLPHMQSTSAGQTNFPNEITQVLLVPASHNLWIVTNMQLYRVNLSTGEYKEVKNPVSHKAFEGVRSLVLDGDAVVFIEVNDGIWRLRY